MHMYIHYKVTVIYVLNVVVTFVFYCFYIYVNRTYPVCPIRLEFHTKAHLINMHMHSPYKPVTSITYMCNLASILDCDTSMTIGYEVDVVVFLGYIHV